MKYTSKSVLISLAIFWLVVIVVIVLAIFKGDSGSSNVSQPINVSAATTTSVTMSEVRKHKTAADCWTVVSGNVYNLTSFVSRHSGGAEPIIESCGVDSTQAFLTMNRTPASPHPRSSMSKLTKYLVGPLQK